MFILPGFSLERHETSTSAMPVGLTGVELDIRCARIDVALQKQEQQHKARAHSSF